MSKPKDHLDKPPSVKYLIVGAVINGPRGLEYVNAESLRDLYGLDKEECLTHDTNTLRGAEQLPKMLGHAHAEGLTVLRPRADGKYKRLTTKGRGPSPINAARSTV